MPKARATPLLDHYSRAWGSPLLIHPPIGGRAHELLDTFAIAEFSAPSRMLPSGRVFATLDASRSEGDGLEFFLRTRDDSPRHAEILTCVAHYHLTGSPLDLHHIVNLGEPWVPGSRCTHAYLSLPYPFGPSLEWLSTAGRRVRCLWLVPLTSLERQYALDHGIESLERVFERNQPDLADPLRGEVTN